MKLSRKACAYIVRHADTRTLQLLVLSFASSPHLPRRLPGGTLLDGEEPLVGLFRELAEETGLDRLTVIRKLGVRQYYKEYTQANVERHDYLLHAREDVPLSFSRIVGGTGGDAGAVFDYRWIGREEFASVDPEFHRDLTPSYVPELFVESTHAASGPEGPVGRRRAEPIVLVNYDAFWPRMFRDQCAVLEEVFETGARIEHVGSTAVPGLGAKPVIDILAGLSKLSEAEARAPQLAWLGYEYVPDYEDRLPDRRYFRKVSQSPCAYHLHCVVRGSQCWKRYLTFRDYLRGHPEAAAAYFTLKKSLAARHEADRVGYTEAKGSFIEAILRKAGRVPGSA